MLDDMEATEEESGQEQEKSEVLLLDADESVRDGLTQLLSSSGIILTATADDGRAMTLAREKHFAVILVDANTPTEGEGVTLVPRFAAASPASEVVLLSQERSFEVAVRGFRAGARDVVAKAPGDVRYLTALLDKLCRQTRYAEERDSLLRETLELHEIFLRRLVEAARRAKEAEDIAAGHDPSNVGECMIVVVDDNPRTATGLQTALGSQSLYHCVAALNGGEALDYAGGKEFQIALVRESLPDLSGTMVARSLQSQSSDAIVLLFDHPNGGKPGYVSIVEKNETIPLVPELKTPDQLVERLRELREAFVAKTRERRYLQAFRQEHSDFLRTYVEHRQKLLGMLAEGQQ